MSCHRASSAATQLTRPALQVADVFRAHGEAYRQSHTLSGDQLKVMRDIEQCRTAALGGHVYVCPEPDCDYQKPVYNSCRNRHCPICQSLSQAKWIEQRIQRILPVHYFHVVFTLPAELRSVVRANRQLLFNVLFASASKTLLQLGDDPKRLGGRLGITAVLHTWTRELLFHPHLHCIVTAGGLAPSGDEWRPLNRDYLFPVKVLGALFRSVQYQRRQTELVILVTPEIIAPLDAHQKVRLPGEDWADPNDFELYALGLLEPRDGEGIESKDGSDLGLESEPDELSVHGPWGHAADNEVR